MPILEIKDLEVYYGHIHALKSISLKVEEGQICALIGANGAGKTTTLKSISGLVKPSNGKIEFCGKPISLLPAHEIVKCGITHVPEGRGIFEDLTIRENLELGGWFRRDRKGILEYIFEIFPILSSRRNQYAGTLSGGEQQMLAIARGLMARPRLLLLDEPSLGLAPILVKEIFEVIKAIRDQGTSILLVEQNAAMALSISDMGYVLETGIIVLEGESRKLLYNEMVRKAYLGED